MAKALAVLEHLTNNGDHARGAKRKQTETRAISALSAELLSKYGLLLLKRGKRNDAIPIFERNVEAREIVYGPRHLKVATAVELVATALPPADAERAAALLQRSLAIKLRVLGPSHSKVGFCLRSVGILQRKAGDLDGALEGAFIVILCLL